MLYAWNYTLVAFMISKIWFESTARTWGQIGMVYFATFTVEIELKPCLNFVKVNF
jgi:hypothetical protein